LIPVGHFRSWKGFAALFRGFMIQSPQVLEFTEIKTQL